MTSCFLFLLRLRRIFAVTNLRLEDTPSKTGVYYTVKVNCSKVGFNKETTATHL